MKLIDKSEVVEEIERRRNYYKRNPLMINAEYCIDEDNAILKFLNTLEVKDVNLDDEKDAYICDHFSEGSDGGMISDAYREICGVTYFDLSNIAEHFFELGIRTQKGE